MANPNIQIDNLVREMTDEEYEAFQSQLASVPSLKLPQAE